MNILDPRTGQTVRMSPRLAAAIERARHYEMTPAEQYAQRRSWVRGQIGLCHPELTPEEVEARVERVLPKHGVAP